MNTTARITIFILASLVAVLGATTLVATRRAPQAATATTASSVASAGSSAEERLRHLLNEQESVNAELRAELARLNRAPATPPSPVASEPAQPRGANLPWLERIRREDPERYRQIVEQREQRRRAADEWFQGKIDELDGRSQTAPTQEEAELAAQIADTLARLHELRDQWAAVRELPEEQRRAASQQLQAETREAYRLLNELRERDRSIQFAQLLQSLGITDANTVQGGVTEIHRIYDNTRYTPPRGEGGAQGWGGGSGQRAP